MNSYNAEQLKALRIIRRHLDTLSEEDRARLRLLISDYLAFRTEIEKFLQRHFTEVCTENCYRSRLSACCTHEGIVAFFADVAINALASSPSELDAIEAVLGNPKEGFKCVFLGEEGCLWRIRPIVCAMFLCDPAREKVFGGDPVAGGKWEAFESRKKDFTWPDKPVLFDELERIFIDAGLRSPLMYMNFSPGLLRVKKAKVDP